MLYPLPPDPQQVLVDFLTAQPDVFAIAAGRVSSTKIDTDSPRIQITAVPAAVSVEWEEPSEFQVDCWGGSEKNALDLARTVCAVIYDLIQAVPTVTGAYPTVLPFASHDPTTGRPRFICQVQLNQSPEATP